jgi:energy-coupling factor transporter ATP-binding protein EcfA2
MKLDAVRVANFRSVDDSQTFSIDDNVTCLIGKNEAGKTAILHALAGLNPHPDTPVTYDRDRDYPRPHLGEYAERHPDKEAKVVLTGWKLDDADIAALEAEIGESVLKSRRVLVARAYGDSDPLIQISADWPSAVRNLIDSARLSASEAGQVGTPANTQQLREVLKSIATPSEKQKSLLRRIEAMPGKGLQGLAKSIVRARLPRFMYFSNYNRMSGSVRLESLRDRIQGAKERTETGSSGDLLFADFLELAGVPLDEITTSATYESISAKLQGASSRITDRVLEYWSQNPHISVNVTVDAAKPGDPSPLNSGTIGRARIYNSLHRVDVPFSERSAGFIWFFSFLVKFSKIDDGSPLVLLLDEPGVTVHGRAQRDLLRFFEERLAPKHQVVYTTHSPFMVAPEKLKSTRIVEDVVERRNGRLVAAGTKVRDDIFDTDADTLLPVRATLGYEVTKTIPPGKNTLLVDAPSDLLYLNALSRALIKIGKRGLDSRWVLCPAGGIGHVKAFVSLFERDEPNIVVFSACDAAKRADIERLRKSGILDIARIITADRFAGKPEAGTEDLFEMSVFCGILNGAYGLEGEFLLNEEKLEYARVDTARLAGKAEAYFMNLPEDAPRYDQSNAPEWLLENPDFFDSGDLDLTKTLNNASALFSEINRNLG